MTESVPAHPTPPAPPGPEAVATAASPATTAIPATAASPKDTGRDTSGEAVPATVLPPWGALHRIAFRFVFSYLVIYLFPHALDLIPGTGRLAAAYFAAWDACLPWVARHLLHLRTAMVPLPEGGGDSTTGFVELVCRVALAAFSTLLWTLMDRRRRDYRRLHAGLRVCVRYLLAGILLWYGGMKLIKVQFIFPPAARLQESYGEASPMGLLWTFMGYSTPYNFFTGAVEAGAGLLLFFRRTTTAGALLGAAAMANVTMINFSYDVHVKHYAGHLLLLSVFLLAPEWRRLANLLVLNRPTAPARAARPPSERRWLRWGRRALKTLFIGYVFISTTRGALQRKHPTMAARSRAAPERRFAVDEFFRNGRSVPASPPDAGRWRSLLFLDGRAALAFTEDDELAGDYDAPRQTLHIFSADHKVQQGVLACSPPDQDHLSLHGTLGHDELIITLHRIVPADFLLVKRGFHWINEVPLNP